MCHVVVESSFHDRDDVAAGPFVASIHISTTTMFAAGNFIYIAAADLIPEIVRETRTRDKLETSAAFLMGLIILLSTVVEPVAVVDIISG